MSPRAGPEATQENVTVLRAHDQRRLAKAFTIATNGVVTKRDYDRATWFTAEERPVAGLRDLHRLLWELEADPFAGVIRGAVAEGADPGRLRRKKTGKAPPFIEAPRRWLMLDVDAAPLPPGSSVLADPHDAALAVLDMLNAHAPELESVGCVVQFSSSAGLNELAEAEEAAGVPPRWGGVAKPGVSAHVWYWLQAAVGEADLKRWFARVNGSAGFKLVDPALAGTVQLHYTAAAGFKGGLRDPLAGRRTLLIEGAADAAALVMPATPQPRAYSAEAGGTGERGAGYAAHLAAIGGPDGFRAPMLRAVAAFVGANWPAPDIATLKADLRQRLAGAEPGGRTTATIDGYASDAALDGIIAWTREREKDKRAALVNARHHPEVQPTFPSRAITLHAAQARAEAVLDNFAGHLAKGEKPELLLRMTVGAGKSEAAILHINKLLDAAREGGREGAAYFLVPRHDLGNDLRERLEHAPPGVKVATWRGMEADDPGRPGDKMCLDPELPKAAGRAGLAHTAPCPACPLRNDCGYRAQAEQKADVWIGAHNLGFHNQSGDLPDAALVVFDEAFWGVALPGTDRLHPIELALSELLDDRTGPVTGMDRQRLLQLRRLVHDAIQGHEPGGLLREAFAAVGLTTDGAAEWLKMEWETKPRVKIKGAVDRGEILERLREAGAAGFNRRRAGLAKNVRDLLNGPDARSINATVHDGCVIRFAWREDFAAWVADAPKLFLDATTSAELVKAWAPNLMVEDIEVEAPHQRVRQIVGAEFGRSKFVSNPNNVRRLADLVVLDLADSTGPVLVVAQLAVEELLRAELIRRFDVVPARLHLAHHGAVTGLDRWRHAAKTIVVGRPALNRLDCERLAEIVKSAPVAVVVDGEAAMWPIVTSGIRMSDGTARGVRQPRHPDPLIEALRWSISEGAVIQAIGRCRGVHRLAGSPAVVTMLGELALPLDVAEVLEWDAAKPDRLSVAAAEALLNGVALPLAPADLAMARSDLFPSAGAAERWLGRFETLKALIDNLYKRNKGFKIANYRRHDHTRGRASLALVPPDNPRAALERAVGPLSFFALVVHPAAVLAPVPPVLVPEAAELLDPALFYRRSDLALPPADVLTVKAAARPVVLIEAPAMGPHLVARAITPRGLGAPVVLHRPLAARPAPVPAPVPPIVLLNRGGPVPPVALASFLTRHAARHHAAPH